MIQQVKSATREMMSHIFVYRKYTEKKKSGKWLTAVSTVLGSIPLDHPERLKW